MKITLSELKQIIRAEILKEQATNENSLRNLYKAVYGHIGGLKFKIIDLNNKMVKLILIPEEGQKKEITLSNSLKWIQKYNKDKEYKILGDGNVVGLVDGQISGGSVINLIKNDEARAQQFIIHFKDLLTDIQKLGLLLSSKIKDYSGNIPVTVFPKEKKIKLFEDDERKKEIVEITDIEVQRIPDREKVDLLMDIPYLDWPKKQDLKLLFGPRQFPIKYNDVIKIIKKLQEGSFDM